MDNLVITIIFAVLIMGLVIAALAIGLILTGRSRLKRGCGLTPGQKKDKTTTCQICGDKKICDEEEEKDDEPRSK